MGVDGEKGDGTRYRDEAGRKEGRMCAVSTDAAVKLKSKPGGYRGKWPSQEVQRP